MGQVGLREQVRERYAEAARAVVERGEAACCQPAAPAMEDNADTFGAARYAGEELAGLPSDAVAASLGCGNPHVVAALHPGDRVLDLGSGGGIDVLLSAKRVGLTGKVYGLDMTEEMLVLARANAAKVDATNVEFLKGQIEAVPLPAASVDVVISNCVINLSTDKPAVLAEMFRVLAPGGRIGVSDVVAEDHVSPEERGERGSYVGCIAGALSRREYLHGLAAAGFTEATVDFTHEAAPGLHGALIRATKPHQARAATLASLAVEESHEMHQSHPGQRGEVTSTCWGTTEQSTCCAPQVKSDCCGDVHAGSCGCR